MVIWQITFEKDLKQSWVIDKTQKASWSTSGKNSWTWKTDKLLKAATIQWTTAFFCSSYKSEWVKHWVGNAEAIILPDTANEQKD